MSIDAESNLSSARFYAILDSGYVPPDQWIAKYDALANGGAALIQIRAKRENAAQRATLLNEVINHRARQGNSENQPPLIVNDDLDLCLSHPDLGLHVGQDDVPVELARQRIGPDRLLGLSTHSPEQVDAALALPVGIIDYFAVGPVFPTQTKPDYIPVGLELVRYAASRQPRLPFFCIGGINRSNIPAVRDAGGRRIVTVSDALCDLDTAAAVRESLRLLR